MILPFEKYLEEGKIEKQVPDVNRGHSLIKKAEKRLRFLRPIASESADLVFEDVYEAMREASQSLMTIRGYKPLSHEALIAYLRDIENFDASIIYKLDSYRKLRNKSIYEAEKIDLIKTKEALAFAQKLLQKIKLIINKNQFVLK